MYKLSEDIRKKERNSSDDILSSSDLLLHALNDLYQDLNDHGIKSYFEYFRNDLKKGSDDIIRWVEELIINFSEIFEIRQQINDSLGKAVFSDLTELSDETKNNIQTLIKEKVAPLFKAWFERRSGVSLSDD